MISEIYSGDTSCKAEGQWPYPKSSQLYNIVQSEFKLLAISGRLIFADFQIIARLELSVTPVITYQRCSNMWIRGSSPSQQVVASGSLFISRLQLISCPICQLWRKCCANVSGMSLKTFRERFPLEVENCGWQMTSRCSPLHRFL